MTQIMECKLVCCVNSCGLEAKKNRTIKKNEEETNFLSSLTTTKTHDNFFPTRADIVSQGTTGLYPCRLGLKSSSNRRK